MTPWRSVAGDDGEPGEAAAAELLSVAVRLWAKAAVGAALPGSPACALSLPLLGQSQNRGLWTHS